MRYLIILGIAIVAVILFWPYLRQLDPTRERADSTRKAGSPIFFAIAICVGLSLALSTFLWLFGK